MSVISTFGTSASGMAAERLRLDTISSNLANINTTRTPEGGPYRRLMAVMESAPDGRGVHVARIVQDESPPLLVHNPGHPDADAEGNVAMPNVNPVLEMVDMISATRAYEANVAAFNAAKAMAAKALEIGKA
ncbi:MAG TPA: flagellar basal body rod protein FlgC [Bacillota bacterium]|nr:flagellar basal body rod protein FlgC [Bacillota bacterium]